MFRFSHEFVESVPIGICAFDADGHLIASNTEAASIVRLNVNPGVTEAEMLGGLRLYDPTGVLLTPSQYPIIRALRANEEILNEEVVLESSDGSRVIVLVSVRIVHDADGAMRGAIAAVRDITAWRHSEIAYRESEARYERAARAGKVGVWDFDIRTNELYISPLLKELLGYDELELPSTMHAWCDLVHPDDVAPMKENTDARLAGNADTYEIECRRMHKDGTYHVFRVRGSIIRDSFGAPIRITGSDTDITEQKLVDDELRDAGRRKDEFLAMLAHELRNPLAAISNATQMLTMPEMADMADWSREVITRQVAQLTRLIDDLLDVSRITRGKIELRIAPIDPATVVTRAVDAVSTLLQDAKHTLDLVLPPDLPLIDADATRLEQVLVNLLTNAIKYTPDGGNVEVRVERDSNAVVFHVCDSGMGIPEDVLPKVFDLFAQDKRSLDRSLGGLGIGLTIVERLVAMHGGSVSARSDGPGKGSTFSVSLPVSKSEFQEIEPLPMSGVVQPRNILIIDDNRDNAVGMAVLLRQRGHHVDMVHDGMAGMERAKENGHDIVLLDIGLPGLDGYEVARRIRASVARQPVIIAVSGYAQQEDRRRSHEAG
ncbi:MAG: PAS domain S-box protein, partial [bacterium]|nr:PAS domain S-box protein [Candidatus Kapabacteria bacterium]